MSLMYETCSVSCHRLMTTVRAWLFIPNVRIMLCQLSSSHGNVQSMVMYSSGIKHALSVFWPYDNGQIILIHPYGMKSDPSVVILHEKGQRMVNHP